jgi:hypothetical protein
MKFGILSNIDDHEEVHGSPARYYGQILDQVVRAEELGITVRGSVSITTPRIVRLPGNDRDGRCRADIAHPSRDGRVTPPSAPPHPAGRGIRDVDQLSGGRLDYGVGRGFLRPPYDLFGIAEDASRERYRESLEVIIRAWTETGPFSHHGKHWSFDHCVSFPPPFQEPYPPIFASGAATPASYTWAGEMGVNLATAFFNPQHHVVQAGIRGYRPAARNRCAT